MRCIGVDIGSSSIKGAVLNVAEGVIEDVVRAPFPNALEGLPSGFHEVSLDAVLLGVRGVLEELAGRCVEAERIYFCSQMGGILLMSESGVGLTNYLSWRDQRTLGTVAAHNGAADRSWLTELRGLWPEAVFQELGRELKPGSATALLYWLVRQGRLPAGAIPATIGDYVIAGLCGVRPRLHRTQGLGMINLLTGEWHTEGLRMLGLGDLSWPEFAGDGEVVGEVELCGRRLSCCASIGDQQAALLGIGLSTGELSVNLSTGAQVSRITERFEPADCQTRCWFDGQYLNTVTHIPAGRSLTVLESLLTELPRLAGVSVGESWRLIGEACEAAGDAGGLECDLSFFAGALGSEGSLRGITTENLTVGHLFQAAFDFVARASAECSRRLSAKPVWERVAVSGGLVQSFPALRRKLGVVLPWPMREVSAVEETLMGLLRLAARC
jgi:sugar (pentulose or hexulose) kinase